MEFIETSFVTQHVDTFDKCSQESEMSFCCWLDKRQVKLVIVLFIFMSFSVPLFYQLLRGVL